MFRPKFQSVHHKTHKQNRLKYPETRVQSVSSDNNSPSHLNLLKKFNRRISMFLNAKPISLLVFSLIAMSLLLAETTRAQNGYVMVSRPGPGMHTVYYRPMRPLTNAPSMGYTRPSAYRRLPVPVVARGMANSTLVNATASSPAPIDSSRVNLSGFSDATTLSASSDERTGASTTSTTSTTAQPFADPTSSAPAS